MLLEKNLNLIFEKSVINIFLCLLLFKKRIIIIILQTDVKQ